MSEVKCDHPGCEKSITIDGTGHPFKKVIRDEKGERRTLFFCSAEHQSLDTHQDLNAPIPIESAQA